MTEKGMAIPDSYWAEDYADYHVTYPDGPGDIDALIMGEQRVPRYAWGDDDEPAAQHDDPAHAATGKHTRARRRG